MLSKPVLILLMVGGAFATGYGVGAYHTSNAFRAEEAEVANARIETIRRELEARERLTLEEARREAVAKERSKTARERGIADAKTKTNPECAIGPDTLSLLNDAISAANGSTDTGAVRYKLQQLDKANLR